MQWKHRSRLWYKIWRFFFLPIIINCPTSLQRRIAYAFSSFIYIAVPITYMLRSKRVSNTDKTNYLSRKTEESASVSLNQCNITNKSKWNSCASCSLLLWCCLVPLMPWFALQIWWLANFKTSAVYRKWSLKTAEADVSISNIPLAH